MSWPMPWWMLAALLYLFLWLATKRFRLSSDVVLAFIIYAGTIANQLWWLFLAQVAVERIFAYVSELERLKRDLAAEEGYEVIHDLLRGRQNEALNRLVADQVSIGELHPRFPPLRNGLRWHAALATLCQIGAYFVIQEIRQLGYLHTV